jgi:MFS family permease
MKRNASKTILSRQPMMATAEKKDLEKIAPNREHYSVFSALLRTYLTYLLGFTILLSTLTATIYFPLIPLLSTHFSVSIQAINITITVYAACQALSPLFFASLADTFGRRPVLLGLIGLYACASLGLALNQKSYAALLALRALQSIGGSATVPIAYGIVADVAVVSERGKMLGPMLATCNGISAVGPVIGGAIALASGDYSWAFLGLLIIAVISLLLSGFTLPETARNVVGNGTKPAHGIWRTWLSVLSGRTKRKDGECDSTEKTAEVDWKTTRQHLATALLASFRISLYPDAALVLWMVAWSYSVYYTIQVAIPVIFEEIYSYNELEIGLAFLPGLIGMTIGGIIAGKLADRNYARTAERHNIDVDRKKGDDLRGFPIEVARYRKCLPFLLFEVALLIGYGWAVHLQVHASVPLIMQFFICGTSTLLSHTASALLIDIFPNMSSTAYASGQIMRCGLGAVSAAILQPLVIAVGRGWYFTIFALFVGISCLAAVVLSRMKGMRWRQKRQDTSNSKTPDV